MDSDASLARTAPRRPARSRRARLSTPASRDGAIEPLAHWARFEPRSGAHPEVLLSVELRAGAALHALDQVVRAGPAWLGALRLRLALQAAIATARLTRRPGDAASLRDAEWLTRAGDDPGPAGRLHRIWRRFASQPARLGSESLPALAAEIGPAAMTSEAVALMRADLDLAQALGWDRPVPLTATVIADAAWRDGGGKRRFVVGGEGWPGERLAVLGLAALRAHALAVDLERRAAKASAAAGSLRTRDGGGGLALVLADDCVAPWRMVARGREPGLGSDRAARRFCESLHALGALRLLTDRPTFRLYGL